MYISFMVEISMLTYVRFLLFTTWFVSSQDIRRSHHAHSKAIVSGVGNETRQLHEEVHTTAITKHNHDLVDKGNAQKQALPLTGNLMRKETKELQPSTSASVSQVEVVRKADIADYDSGWFAVEKNNNYDKNHGLGAQPSLAIMWAASDCTGANMNLMDGIYSSNGYGAWLQRIDNNGYRVSTGPNSAMSGYGVDNHWAWDDGNGCVRVLMWGGDDSLMPGPDYDSGWFKVEKNKNYDQNHDLGDLPTLAIMWAASDSSGANMYKMDGIYSSHGYGAWLQRITNSEYRVSTGPNSAMSGYGVDNHWAWDDGSGYIRVLMWGGADTALPDFDHDTSWFSVSKNQNYEKEHGMSEVPAFSIMWAATDNQGAHMNLMDGIYSSHGFGAWMQRINTNSFRVSTGPKSAMSGYGKDNHWAWDDGSGYIRVISWKTLATPPTASPTDAPGDGGGGGGGGNNSGASSESKSAKIQIWLSYVVACVLSALAQL